jgi:MOSC domain-containing protein YiiM
MPSEVVSVNVSTTRTVEYDGKLVETGIFKEPVAGRVALHGVNLDGDDQADRSVHGGPEQVVYAYALEDYQWWEPSVKVSLAPGKFGENLTTRGIDVNGALVGEQWRVGSTVLQVTGPRVPCSKLAMAMDDPQFIKKFAQALRPGAYFSVAREGHIGAGDSIEIVLRPRHHLTVAEMAKVVLFERSRLRELLAVPELSNAWRDWIAGHTTE